MMKNKMNGGIDAFGIPIDKGEIDQNVKNDNQINDSNHFQMTFTP